MFNTLTGSHKEDKMNNKETIKKLIKVAKQQQLIIKKLAQQVEAATIQGIPDEKRQDIANKINKILTSKNIQGVSPNVLEGGPPYTVELTGLKPEQQTAVLKDISTVLPGLIVITE